jgi:regulator of protease activity HflC (stomatin/prohibitin superfamily)
MIGDRRFWVWIFVTMIKFVVGVILLLTGLLVRNLTSMVAGIVILVWLLPWIRNGPKVVGTTATPQRAVIVTLGRPTGVVGPGLTAIFWPFQEIVIYPTKQFLLNYNLTRVHSKREVVGKRRFATHRMDIDLAVYFRWPEGEELKQSFIAAPTPTGNFEDDTKILTEFFGPAVDDAVRNKMAQRNHEDCRQKKEEIEQDIKAYLLGEEGNPFREAAIPKEHLDIDIQKIVFDERVEEAFVAPEIGERKAEEERAYLDVLLNAGVPPILAGILIQGEKAQEGKGFDWETLMQLAIALRFLGIDIEWKRGRPKSSLSEEEIKKRLKKEGIDKEDEIIAILKAEEII